MWSSSSIADFNTPYTRTCIFHKLFQIKHIQIKVKITPFAVRCKLTGTHVIGIPTSDICSASFAGFANGNFCYRIYGSCARDDVEDRGLPRDRALWFWQFHNLSIGRTARCAQPVGDRQCLCPRQASAFNHITTKWTGKS